MMSIIKAFPIRDEFLDYANGNRLEWASKGQSIDQASIHFVLHDRAVGLY
jgi:hypothetical protein